MQLVSESPVGLVKTQILCSIFRVSDSLALVWEPRKCTSKNLPENADANSSVTSF